MKREDGLAYTRGYNAGRKRSEADEASASIERQAWHDAIVSDRRKFLDAVFLAVIPQMVNAQGWTTGGKPVTATDERVKVAWTIANEAFSQRTLK